MIELELKADGMTGRKFWKATGEDADFKCSQCFKLIDIGFTCEDNRNLVLCQYCQDNFEMSRCKHDKFGEHRHIKFQRAKKMSHILE